MLKDNEFKQDEEVLEENTTEAGQDEVVADESIECAETEVASEPETMAEKTLDDKSEYDDLDALNQTPGDIAGRGTKAMAERIRTAIEMQEIFYASVVKVQELGPDKQVMTASIKNPELRHVNVLIPRRDADLDFKTGDLFHLLGNDIPVVLTGRTATKNLVGSRKMAQSILKEFHMEDISSGVEMNATILSFGFNGAFMAADKAHGYVVGYLRDMDYSSDYLSVKESKKVGDTIRVRCSSVNEEGRISWEAVEKVQRTEAIVCMVEKGCSCEGVVKTITTFPSGERVFVTIQPGVDASCLYPSNFTVEPGDKVFLKVQEIYYDEAKLVPKVKAIIIKVK